MERKAFKNYYGEVSYLISSVGTVVTLLARRLSDYKAMNPAQKEEKGDCIPHHPGGWVCGLCSMCVKTRMWWTRSPRSLTGNCTIAMHEMSCLANSKGKERLLSLLGIGCSE